MVNIFTYLDYRQFLKDKFKELKSTRKSFSHRAFAKMAGFSSSNFVMLVMQGKRNLSSEAIQKVAKGLKLKKAEAEFFENLVRFNQASGDDEKNFYYSRISSNRQYAKSKPLEKGQFDYYSNWYIPAIREMVLLEDFKEDPEWIAQKLSPQITAREAEAALKLLLDLGLLVRDKSGKLIQEDRHISSGDEVSSLAVKNFQRDMIEKAAASIDATPAKLREIGSVTFAVKKEKLAEAKRMIREFRSKLSGFLAEEEKADAVYQFNLQVFNLSKVDEGKE
jgi:uncharacterized protein (TIGR02147 family)